MTDINYEVNDSDEEYRIDEKSQRLLVYLHLHGDTSLDETLDPIGAENESEVHSRIEQNLGSNAAGVIEKHEFTRNTLTGEQEVLHYQLTEDGESFVYNNKATLSMPADLAELAKKVAELRVEQDELMDIKDRVVDLEARLTELEEQL